MPSLKDAAAQAYAAEATARERERQQERTDTAGRLAARIAELFNVTDVQRVDYHDQAGQFQPGIIAAGVHFAAIENDDTGELDPAPLVLCRRCQELTPGPVTLDLATLGRILATQQPGHPHTCPPTPRTTDERIPAALEQIGATLDSMYRNGITVGTVEV